MVRRLALLVVLSLVTASCVFGQDAATTTEAPLETTTPGPPRTSIGEPGSTTTSLAEPTWTDLPGVADLPEDVRDQLLELVRATEEIRGLRFIDPPLITVVTDDELAARVRALIEEEAEDFPADEALYKLLGLLDAEVDLETLLIDLYSEQVAGFYDGETGELVVPMRDRGFSVVQRSTMIHELTHSLTDQHFDFDPLMQQMFDEERLDEASAFQALVEGDASLAEFIYIQSLSQRELGEFFAEALETDFSILEAAPPFIQDSLIFPYDSGLAFVQRLYSDGDWVAVNEAYSTLPGLPGSTEQIITPSDYRRDLPSEVTLPVITIPGYTLERESVWGELGLRIMLDQELGEGVGVDAADGWGGDTYYQWYDGANAAFLLVYAADTAGDLDELKDALVDYAVSAVADEDYVWVEVIDGNLVFIAADDPEIGVTILDSVKT
jgi:hypothetical protein